MRKIKDLNVNVYSLDLTGWTLDIAYGISGDGNIIAGSGRNPSGKDHSLPFEILQESCLIHYRYKKSDFFRDD